MLGVTPQRLLVFFLAVSAVAVLASDSEAADGRHKSKLSSVQAGFRIEERQPHDLPEATHARFLGEEEKKKEGEGEKKEGGEEKEEGEEGVDETSLTLAFLLCGIVAFTVSLFYLVNYNDENIKRCTWELISDTVSIFCAVLWYQGMDALLDEQLEKEKENKVTRFIVSLIHFLFWYLGVQAVAITLCQSKTFGFRWFKGSCVLGAHCAGFAAIQMWNGVMQAKPFRDSVGLCIVVVLMAVLTYSIFCVVCFQVRNRFIYPHMREEQRDKCGEEVREIENDMVALSIGFLISAVLRFAIHGKLPTEELDEKDDHEQWQAWTLYAFSIVFAFLAIAFLKLQFDGVGERHEFKNKHAERLIDMVKMSMVMTMAWCLLFWGQWEIFDTHLVKRATLARVILALLLSYYGLIWVFILDFIADRLKSRYFKRSCRLVTIGFGLALAFSWEQTFDVSIEDIAEGTKHFDEGGLKMLVAAGLCIIVAPAWGAYILPKTFEEAAEGEKKEEKEGEAGAKPLPEGSAPQMPSPDIEAAPVGDKSKIAPDPEGLREAGKGEADAAAPGTVGKVGEAWN